MMTPEQKKEAARKFKERKPDAGIYEIASTATGRLWVGPSRNLEASRNSLSLALRQGGHRNRALQAEFETHGASALRFQVLERFDPELSPLLLGDAFKARMTHWRAKRQAEALTF